MRPKIRKIALGLLICVAAAEASQILYPQSGVVLNNATIEIIARRGVEDTSKLKLNGAEVKSTVVGDVVHGRVQLKKGANTIELGDQKSTLSFDPDAKVPTYYYHPMLIDDGTCSDCHMTEQGVGRDTIKMNDQGMAVCVDCHDEKMEAKVLHGPVGTGNCYSCHNPHASANVHMLRMKVTEICNMCHPSEMLDENHAKIVVGAGEQNACLDCHDPHGSGQQFQLQKEPNTYKR